MLNFSIWSISLEKGRLSLPYASTQPTASDLLVSSTMALSQEDRLCECLLILTALLHVLICPFSKVEETLNLHAIYDILTKGLSDDAVASVRYSHFEQASVP